MKAFAKALLRSVFAEYELIRVYRRALPTGGTESRPTDPAIEFKRIASREEVARSSDSRIRDHAWYFGEHAPGWGAWVDGDLQCITWFWTRNDERARAKFPLLREDEAVMMDLLTSERARGKGLALAITREAEQGLASLGYRSAWTWVWHSNTPSIRVFEKAQWLYSHFEVVFQFRGTERVWRWRLPAR